MDDLLPLTVYDFIICAFMVFGGVLIVFIVNPWVVLRCAAGFDSKSLLVE